MANARMDLTASVVQRIMLSPGQGKQDPTFEAVKTTTFFRHFVESFITLRLNAKAKGRT